jgi:hypothetical protein
MFARKLSRLAGLVLVFTVAFSFGATGASAAEASRDVHAVVVSTLSYDWS